MTTQTMVDKRDFYLSTKLCDPHSSDQGYICRNLDSIDNTEGYVQEFQTGITCYLENDMGEEVDEEIGTFRSSLFNIRGMCRNEVDFCHLFDAAQLEFVYKTLYYSENDDDDMYSIDPSEWAKQLSKTLLDNGVYRTH